MSRPASFSRSGAIAALLTAGAFAACSPANGQANGQRSGPGNGTPAVGVHVVPLPASVSGDQGKQVTVLLETPRLKIATISLRGGTVLPPHSAPTPITIQTLSGSGTLRANDEDHALNPGVLYALAPDQSHSVVPDGDSDIVLLIHHVKARRGPARR